MSSAPVRNPPGSCPRTPAPRRWRKGSGIAPLARLAAHLNRLLYRLPLVRRLRRLLCPAQLSPVELRLARGGDGLDGLRIALVSDVHAGTFMDEADVARMFEQVAEARPDLVCLAGDLVNDRPEQMLCFRRPLQTLAPRFGVWAVPGNHEYAAERDLKLFRDVLSEAGVRLLLNEGERLLVRDSPLWMAGVDDYNLGAPDVPLAVHGADPDEPILLLSHHPDLFPESASLGVDLTLAGHTHGGQIVLGGRTPLRHTRLGFWRGHFRARGAQLYVSRGVGVTILPLRIGARAEIPILTLRTR